MTGVTPDVSRIDRAIPELPPEERKDQSAFVFPEAIRARLDLKDRVLSSDNSRDDLRVALGDDGIGVIRLGVLNPFLHPIVQGVEDAVALFPSSEDAVREGTARAKERAEQSIQAICAIPAAERSFENTVLRADQVEEMFGIQQRILEIVAMVHPKAGMRDMAQKCEVELGKFSVDLFEGNRELYQAVRDYVAGRGQDEALNSEQTAYLADKMKSFRRNGLELDASGFQEVTELKKQLADLESEFEKNIAEDKSQIVVSRAELAGMDEDFISAHYDLEMAGCVLTTQYPTYFAIMDRCETESTRKQLYKLFNNRACPRNVEVLKEVLSLRQRLAKKLGYESFAHLALEPAMAKDPATVETVINRVVEKSSEKLKQEMAVFLQDLPPSVKLNEDGTLNPWDIRFVLNQYSKSNLQVDEEKISEYFPMESTIKGLMEIYSRFFNLDFKMVPAEGLWHQSVQMMEVSQKNGERLGYLVLDLFPREGKFSHACCESIVPPLVDGKGGWNPAYSVVIANFAKSTSEKPSLLEHGQVQTFFHEFGHAIHCLFGRAQMPTLAAFNTKEDFVEMPSQILEEWLWQPEILQMLGKHYKTGESLPPELLDAKIKAKNFDSGYATLRQMVFASLSLELHKRPEVGDPRALLEEISRRLIPSVAVDETTHFEASFGHLMGYSARYYTYVWSEIFAHDVFKYIRAHDGLLDPELGARYVREIIGRGGSLDPYTMLYNFLGRESNEEAFLEALGI